MISIYIKDETSCKIMALEQKITIEREFHLRRKETTSTASNPIKDSLRMDVQTVSAPAHSHTDRDTCG